MIEVQVKAVRRYANGQAPPTQQGREALVAGRPGGWLCVQPSALTAVAVVSPGYASTKR